MSWWTPWKCQSSLPVLASSASRRVGVEVVADAVGAVEVVDGGAGGGEDDAALLVDDHAGPVVGGAGGLPGVLGPGLVAGFAGVGDGVEAPAQLAGVDVVGADVAVRGGVGLWRAEADDDQVFVDHAGGGEDGEVAGEVARCRGLCADRCGRFRRSLGWACRWRDRARRDGP